MVDLKRYEKPYQELLIEKNYYAPRAKSIYMVYDIDRSYINERGEKVIHYKDYYGKKCFTIIPKYVMNE